MQITHTDTQPEVPVLSLAIVPKLHDVEVDVQIGHAIMHGVFVLEDVDLRVQRGGIGLACRRVFDLKVALRGGGKPVFV